MLKKVKDFIKENGFTSLLLLVAAVALAFLGLWFAFWFFCGGFVINNWNAFVTVYKKYAKSKVDVAIKQVEDKAKDKVNNVVSDVKKKL